MIDRLLFIIGEAFVGLRRNAAIVFAAVSTVALSLFVLGAIGSAYWALDSYARSLPARFEMRVFLRDGTPRSGLSAFANRVRALPGVASATLIPKELAWRRFTREEPELARGVDNPFPDAFKVTLSSLDDSDRVARQIREMPMVDADGVQYNRQEERYVGDALHVLRWTGSTLGALLLLTSGILIFNAIRLALVSRRLEVRLMQLVGASPGTVYAPFLIEGAIQGALGGALAGLMLKSAHIVLSNFLRSVTSLSSLPPFPDAGAIGGLAVIGAGYGFLLSALALIRLTVRTR